MTPDIPPRLAAEAPLFRVPVRAQIKKPFGLTSSGTWSTLKNGFGPIQLRVTHDGVHLDFAGRLGKLLVPGLSLEPTQSTMEVSEIGWLGTMLFARQCLVLSGPSPRGPLQMAIAMAPAHGRGAPQPVLLDAWRVLLNVGVRAISEPPDSVPFPQTSARGAPTPSKERAKVPQTNRRWSWQTATISWLLALVVVGLLFNVTGPGWLTLNALAHEGQQTSATVVRLEPNNHNGCAYAYVVQGHPYTGSDSLCGGGRQVGDPLPITYVAADPASSTSSSPAPADALRTSLIFWLLFSTVLAVGVGSVLTSRAGRPGR